MRYNRLAWIVAGCLLAWFAGTVTTSATATDSELHCAYSMWFGGQSSIGTTAASTGGTCLWDARRGTLGLTIAPVREIVSIPSDAARAFQPQDGEMSSLVRKTGEIEVTWRRDTQEVWRLESAKETPPGKADAGRDGVDVGRMIVLALTGRANRELATFDPRTLSSEQPRLVRITPFSSQKSKMDPEGNSDFSTDLLLVRIDGLNVEMAALHYGESGIRAVFANVWAGGAPSKGDRRALALAGVEKVESLFRSVQNEEDMKDAVITDFLKSWQEWRTDVDVYAYVFDIKLEPQAEEDEPTGPGVDDDQKSESGTPSNGARIRGVHIWCGAGFLGRVIGAD